MSFMLRVENRSNQSLDRYGDGDDEKKGFQRKRKRKKRQALLQLKKKKSLARTAFKVQLREAATTISYLKI